MDFVITGDGSKTLFHAEIGEHYHSKHGAYEESKHVFLKSGLQFMLEKDNQEKASVLEVGFGTGLNFLLTADYCTKNAVALDYCGIEAFPLDPGIIQQIGYEQYMDKSLWDDFLVCYPQSLMQSVRINKRVTLEIAYKKVLDFETDKSFDVVYFDAFAAVHQPDMWTDEVLAHVTSFLRPGGVFVTYAITGNLKRSMKALGFRIEKAPGAPGKREMLRAVKDIVYQPKA